MKRVIKYISIISIILVNLSLTKTNKVFPKSNTLNNCTAILEVEKNRNSKSIFKSDLKYKLILTNTSNKKTSYKVEMENTKEELKNLKSRFSKSKKTIKTSSLKAITLNSKNKSINEIVLNPGEKYTFNVLLSKIDTKSFNTWNLTKVKVYSLECKEIIASTILKTFIPNPELR
ncbi:MULTISPECIES: hypothetical protein [Tenacibaculum]|uniref:hypothetical protein n=1 Tax=Tenacibaculum TaxID=104267 RepID=UPI001F0AC7FD|nr:MULTISPECIES: hypothetical protein [Tenacibaculum]MCH3881932.1 hypothetical protein [Tenacibaculum aquimarinum]MCH3884976.1 hypothetical protein [Tenacibaculum aquimarinum]MDO6600685.1 hypothetical protein [Tenacibaculum sp. 1_MG-2023]